MRILIQECKKMLSVRLLLLLALFTVLFYNMFFELNLYPAGGQCTDSPYDMPYAAKLIRKYGSTLPVTEKGKIEKEVEDLKKQSTKLIREDSALIKAGISDFDTMMKERDRLTDYTDEQMSEKEQKEKEAIMDFTSFETEGEKIMFQIQYANSLLDDFALTDRPEVNLLRSGALYILQTDMSKMPVMILICYAVLLVAYHVRERIRGVMPLYSTTKTGREIYPIQYLGGFICCLIIGVLQLLAYTIVWYAKGMGIFWQCPAWETRGIECWIKGISFGQYMGIYEILVLLFCIAAMALIYGLARLAQGYITGVVLSIPGCVITGAAGSVIFEGLCSSFNMFSMKMWELYALTGCVALAVLVVYFRLRWDEKRDIL